MTLPQPTCGKRGEELSEGRVRNSIRSRDSARAAVETLRTEAVDRAAAKGAVPP